MISEPEVAAFQNTNLKLCEVKVLTSHHSSAPSSVEKQNYVTLCTVLRGNITTWAVAQ